MFTPNLFLKKGEVSRLDTSTAHFSNNNMGASKHTLSMYIGDAMAEFVTNRHAGFKEGDHVTVSGEFKNGKILIHSYRNDTTGFQGGLWENYNLTFAWLLLLGGAFLSLLIVGIPVLIYGVVYYINAATGSKAKKMVDVSYVTVG